MGGRSGQSINNSGGVNSISNVEKRISSQNFESAAVYDNNGNQLFFKNGSSNAVVFNNEELTQMKGNVLTHNHPSGGAFSGSDVALLVSSGLSEIRAVAGNSDIVSKFELKERTYSLKNLGTSKSAKTLKYEVEEIYRSVQEKSYSQTNNEKDWRQFNNKESIKRLTEYFKANKFEFTIIE